MKAIITLLIDEKETRDISIDLIDSKYVQHMIEHNDANDWSFKLISAPAIIHNPEPDAAQKLWEEILHHYNTFLELTGAEDLINPPNFPEVDIDNFAIPHWEIVSKHYTNLLHRVFTTYHNFQTYYGYEYRLTDDRKAALAELNTLVHKLERHIKNESQSNFVDQYGRLEWCEVRGTEDRSHAYWFDEDEKLEADTEANVHCIKHILGKDHLTAFFDDDDPHAWDVVTCWMGYCGFQIDFKGTLNQAWKHQPFLDWCDGEKIGHYPIGNICEEDLEYLQKISEPIDQHNNRRKIETVGVEYVD